MLQGKETNGLPWPSSKYYDLYDYGTNEWNFQRGILGDATKEFGPFYSVQFKKADNTYGPSRTINNHYADHTAFVYHLSPWFTRGSAWNGGTESGITSFEPKAPEVRVWETFRVVLTP